MGRPPGSCARPAGHPPLFVAGRNRAAAGLPGIRVRTRARTDNALSTVARTTAPRMPARSYENADHMTVARAGPNANPMVRARLVDAPVVATNGEGALVIAIAIFGAFNRPLPQPARRSRQAR